MSCVHSCILGFLATVHLLAPGYLCVYALHIVVISVLSPPLPGHRFQLRGFFCSIKAQSIWSATIKDVLPQALQPAHTAAINVQRFSHKSGLVLETTLSHEIVRSKGPSDQSSLGSPSRSDTLLFCPAVCGKRLPQSHNPRDCTKGFIFAYQLPQCCQCGVQ